ncbi:hypothetical protein [Lysinibacillus xylanilyticus]|uniref:hypothetical protein n=1 Tax=Lysinibacillus xylanilyticus TaxID=582475 RepID=UPI003D98644B
MKEQLIKAMRRNQMMNMMYMAKGGQDLVLTYANQALKTQVEKLLLSHQNN